MTGLIIDNFAGGGGASTALEAAFGRHVDIAINHNAKALALHAANHPRTLHLHEDVFAVDPFDVCNGRPIDAAWFSPDCTHFSKAKGGKPRSKKIRGLAWVVLRWASLPEWQRPRVIFLENVEEFETWGPLDAEGYPIPELAGTTYQFWKRSLEKRGYIIESRKLRACDYGAPTIRNRFFLVARRDGNPIIWPAVTHRDPKKPRPPQIRLKLEPYRTAAECIDWSIPCPSIFERKKPLAENTLRRIARGVMRYVVNNPTPFIVRVTQSSNQTPVNLHAPLPTITTAKGGELVLVSPTIINTRNGERKGQEPRCRDIEGPYPTVTAVGSQGALVCAHLNTNRNAQKPYNGADEPVHTITAGGAHINLVAAFLAQHNTGNDGHPATKPVSTIISKGCTQGLVAAHLMSLKGSDRRAMAADDPTPTICAGGTHVAEVRAFLLSYYGASEEAVGIDGPLHTVTTRDRFGLVTVHGQPYEIVDIGMRMLTPRELYRAQGFPEDYKIDVEFEGKPLTKSDQIRMVGNSVSPPPATALAIANAPILSRRETVASPRKRRRAA